MKLMLVYCVAELLDISIISNDAYVSNKSDYYKCARRNHEGLKSSLLLCSVGCSEQFMRLLCRNMRETAASLDPGRK